MKLMAESNFQRMIALAEEVFDSKKDSNQLDINPEVMERLLRIHPATISEHDDGNGPVAWMILIPTTTNLRDEFLAQKISEKELFEKTPLDTPYEALYLCSAMVLEEYRRKGIAQKLVTKAIESIRKDHPIKSLFVWAFSKEGDAAAEALAHQISLPLLKRTK